MQVWTNDLDKGAEIASKIQSGMRGVNAHPGSGPNTPFGGVKQSGIGVEGAGKLGLKEFVDVTTLRVAKTGARYLGLFWVPCRSELGGCAGRALGQVMLWPALGGKTV